LALGALDRAAGFGERIAARLERGQKLLFKPNLVNAHNIDPGTLGPGPGSTACTEWPFVAALMRWFHDRMGIDYHRMALGEASTTIPAAAHLFSSLNPEGRPVTPQAVIEGRAGGFYGGWGFYFVRRYLAEGLAPGRTDDPMRGYEESVAGLELPPGRAPDRLMVYDLNRLFDDPSKGRRVPVPDGINFRSITLHKAVVGGAPDDPADRADWPGCVLVNVPKLKVHVITLLTNAIKNLGIGLYPMQWSEAGGRRWDYASPHDEVPGIKSGIPHEVWVPEIDPRTDLPLTDASGRTVARKTGGIDATMIDVIKATQAQDVFMLHVVDAVETINLDHQGIGWGEKVPEGLILAGLDPVALDLLSARYLFGNVPMARAVEVDLDDGAGGRFPQAVPLAAVQDGRIVTRQGFDCPLARDLSLARAEARGLGRRTYHVIGRDLESGSPIVSIQGRPGLDVAGRFEDLTTSTLYYALFKMPWDLQRTSLSYLAAVDQLTGSSLERDFIEAMAGTGADVVRYEDFGRKGMVTSIMHLSGRLANTAAREPFGWHKARFVIMSRILKASSPAFNVHGADPLKEYCLGFACLSAWQMSLFNEERPDPFRPGLTWGRGRWPSFQLAWFVHVGRSLYGDGFPETIGAASMFSNALFYADMVQNQGRLTIEAGREPESQAAVVNRYIAGLRDGRPPNLDFTLYVPLLYDQIGGAPLPHVEATADPARVLTVRFNAGGEVWPEA
ncbi:MAG: DUF362 domain-containing protein, partial [Proteobacteria bacterium]|nr:DUF362 domain-containing protein [Pseudomonadota bacterium]